MIARALAVVALALLAGCSLDLERLRRGTGQDGGATADGGRDDGGGPRDGGGGPRDAGEDAAPPDAGPDGGACPCSHGAWSRSTVPFAAGDVTSLQVLDLDDDGDLDVLAMGTGEPFAVMHRSVRCVESTIDLLAVPLGLPPGVLHAAAPLSGARRPEILEPVMSQSDLRLHETRGSDASFGLAGSTTLRLPFPPERVFAHDLDGDGSLEAIATAATPALVVIESTSSVGAGQSTSVPVTRTAALGAADGAWVFGIQHGAEQGRGLRIMGGIVVAMAPTPVSGASFLVDVVTGDIDGAPPREALFLDSRLARVFVVRPEGGTVRDVREVTVRSDPSAIAVGDLDGDGVADLAVAHPTLMSIDLLRGMGDGSFVVMAMISLEAPRSLALADMDGDGRDDLVVGHRMAGSSAVTVMLQSCAP